MPQAFVNRKPIITNSPESPSTWNDPKMAPTRDTMQTISQPTQRTTPDRDPFQPIPNSTLQGVAPTVSQLQQGGDDYFKQVLAYNPIEEVAKGLSDPRLQAAQGRQVARQKDLMGYSSNLQNTSQRLSDFRAASNKQFQLSL